MGKFLVASVYCGVLLGCEGCLIAQSEQTAVDANHGTCAIVLATTENMAFIVDSKLTKTSSSDSSCVQSNPLGCKGVLARKDLLIAVTGVYDDPINGSHWLVGDETQELVKSLPATLEERNLDALATAWFNTLANHYREKGANLAPNGGRSTLLIATRIHGAPIRTKS
jgi:hypothetical protein